MSPGLRRSHLVLPLLACLVLGCGRLSPRTSLSENQPPEVVLDPPRVRSVDQPLDVHWTAHDPDGRIDHFVYALNPASVDRVDASWVRTEQSGAVIRFARRPVLGRAGTALASATWPHIFAVRAVDDVGALSAPATFALFDSTGLAPRVTIVDPAPNAVFTTVVPPSFIVQWSGSDLDGRIVRYKYRLFQSQNPDHPEIPDFISLVMNDPDTLRGLYSPSFPGWDSVGANVTSKQYTNLNEHQIYLFAITAIDNDGNYDPVFSTNSNVLRFGVSQSVEFNPQLCVSSSLFNYCATIGGDLDLSYEIPAARPLLVSWIGLATQGNGSLSYRWVVDPRDTTDLKDRDHQNADPNHWTAWGSDNTSTTVGPFDPSDPVNPHVLYIQARDEVERTSTAKVRFTITHLTFAHELLVIDDTRLTPDQRNASGVLDPPRGPWPTAAELDTFLYARGGYPWQGYPAGTFSSPGLLAGYDFDTLGTRQSLTGIVPLSVLGQYRQVIWMTDDVGATYTGAPTQPLGPITSLRYMSLPGQVNTLSTYVAQGGKLWIMGGGAAYATLADWNRRNTPPGEWTNSAQELIPGRFMYDFPHWRSSVATRPASLALLNTPLFAPWPNAAIGRGWSAQGFDHNLSQPDYGKLAAIQVLAPRTCATDPPSPLRFCNSFFFPLFFEAEYIGRVPPNPSVPNYVQENIDPRPNHEEPVSTLDTLYMASGGTMPGPLPVMTYYHGFESGPVVFSGFPVWYFQRAQSAKLVDFVLQDIWGVTRHGGTATTAAVASRRR